MVANVFTQLPNIKKASHGPTKTGVFKHFILLIVTN